MGPEALRLYDVHGTEQAGRMKRIILMSILDYLSFV